MTLHVTTASFYKTHSSNETLKFLAQKFHDRKKSDRDIWLFGLEVSMEDMLETRNMYIWINIIQGDSRFIDILAPHFSLDWVDPLGW